MIGIVGGLGPYAGLDLLRKVYDQTLAVRDQEHLDTILISMPSSFAERTEYLTGRLEENPGMAIAGVVKQLDRAGATVAGIPCNTAHAEPIFRVIPEELKKAGCRIRLLHIIEETIAFIRSEYGHLKRIGVLSTTGAYHSHIFKDPLEENGFTVYRPPMEMQEAFIHTAIHHPEYGIKSFSDPVHPRSRENLMVGIRYLKAAGAEAVILGCTEIPIAIPERTIEGMVAIDPTLILARALISFEAPEKLKPLSP